MNFISAIDMFKIGVGPSSSHTLGPWRAALEFLTAIDSFIKQKSTSDHMNFDVTVHLYGSLAQTGKGHGTDIAIICGMLGLDYITCPTTDLIKNAKKAYQQTPFNQTIHRLEILMHPDICLDVHANGMKFILHASQNESDNIILLEKIFYSIGGGFIMEEGATQQHTKNNHPHTIVDAQDLLEYETQGLPLIALITENEKALHGEYIYQHLNDIWQTMRECIYQGCIQKGLLMGGLGVHRRAANIYENLCVEYGLKPELNDIGKWQAQIADIFNQAQSFNQSIKLISTFALAVNEQNAAFSRVVTAPTNGSAGVIPAVLMYALYGLPYLKNQQNQQNQKNQQNQHNIENAKNAKNLEDEKNLTHAFLMVASTIGGLFKQKATISAAMGGCQAEIGVSSSMAAAGLTHIMGGNCAQVLMAAEIAMEHHLGLTCDPVGGLVQIPCIERNAMGAIKAITAANLALASEPSHAKVSLDAVIQTMWQTAQDMHQKYKETATGGLAINIPVSLSEC